MKDLSENIRFLKEKMESGKFNLIEVAMAEVLVELYEKNAVNQLVESEIRNEKLKNLVLDILDEAQGSKFKTDEECAEALRNIEWECAKIDEIFEVHA